MTHCRMLLAIHAVHELPAEVLDSVRSAGDTLVLHIAAMGERFIIPLDLERSTVTAGRQSSSVIPVHRWRVFHFFRARRRGSRKEWEEE